MQHLFELVGRVQAQVWVWKTHADKKNRINVNDSGLRQALIENLFELVGRGEAQVELRNQVLSFLICICFFQQGGGLIWMQGYVMNTFLIICHFRVFEPSGL